MNITPVRYDFPNYKTGQSKPAKQQNPSFGIWCKGESWAEKSFINTVRKQRDGHCRKFTEFDILEFLSGLRKFKDIHEGITALKDLLYFSFHEAYMDGPLMKNLYTLMAGRDEDERFAILEYAKYTQDICSSGLEVMFKLPEETQEELVGILNKINSANNPQYFKGREDYDYMRESMFANFDILVFAHDDLKNSAKPLPDSYKIENFLLLHDCTKLFKKSNLNEDWVNTMQGMEEYFIDKFMTPNC